MQDEHVRLLESMSRRRIMVGAPREITATASTKKVVTYLPGQMEGLGIPANLWMIVLSSGSAQERMLANGCMEHTQSASSDT